MTNASLLVIAEAGVNHNGDLGRAREMVAAAAAAGADYVKFQAFSAENLVTAGAGTAAYQAKNTGKTEQADLLADLEISADGMAALAALCDSQGIRFLCTPFDVAGAADLVALGMDRIKIASGTSVSGAAPCDTNTFPMCLASAMYRNASTASALEKTVYGCVESSPRARRFSVKRSRRPVEPGLATSSSSMSKRS